MNPQIADMWNMERNVTCSGGEGVGAERRGWDMRGGEGAVEVAELGCGVSRGVTRN